MISEAQWRERLLGQQRQLEADLVAAEQASAPVELDQSRVGRLSRMDAMQAQAMSLASDQRRQLELTKIHSALARLDAGSFGACVKCGDDIAVDRLEHFPSNPLCLECAENLER